jgi:xanthine dehydrogenase accessory factor
VTVYSTDREILQTAIDWINQGHDVVLVTVAKTWGSSPRPRGSMLIMRKDGIHAGSVSGGCVEDDLILRYKNNELSEQFPNLIDYGVDRQDALRFGLPCGGRLELVLEKLESATQLDIILQKISQGELTTRRLCMNTGEVSIHKHGHIKDFDFNEDEMIKVYGHGWHLLLIGAGHLSRYVANIALTLDYRITVCDPREEYQQSWEFEGVEFTTAMPDDAVTNMNNTNCGIVIALTHDPKLDDMALMVALDTSMFYVGALGSKRSSESRRSRLLELGITQEHLSKLHAPVGMDIGSHTPPEIAVAIMAEITAKRNNVSITK